jgi:hypothetical protein
MRFEHLPDQLTAKLVAELDWFLSWTILSWIIRTWVWSKVPVIEDCSLSDVSKLTLSCMVTILPSKRSTISPSCSLFSVRRSTLFSILVEIQNIFEIPFEEGETCGCAKDEVGLLLHCHSRALFSFEGLATEVMLIVGCLELKPRRRNTWWRHGWTDM